MTRRRMSPRDSLWLELDRPENLMVITSVLWTSTPVDPDRLRAVVTERLTGRYPVFRERPVLRTGVIRRAYWAADADFDLDRHVIIRPMPGVGDRAALQDFVAEQRGVPLDRNHPLWRIHVLQGYGEGSAVVQRYHHAMADGVRLTEVMLHLLDPLDGRDSHLTARVGGSRPVSGSQGVAGTALTLLHTAASAVKLGLWTNPHTVLDGTPGLAKTAAWTEPMPLERLSMLAEATGTSINDVAVTLVAGALARYLGARGATLPAEDDDIAWMVPVNLDPPGLEPPVALGNHFALVLAVLPHGPAPFHARLAEVHRRLSRIRDSWEPLITFGLAQGIAVSSAPVGAAATRFLAAKAVGVLTNVPGPRTSMALAGSPVTGVVGWAPCSGPQTMTVCVFSYAGTVTVGFGTDRSVVPDPERLVAAFHTEIARAERDEFPGRLARPAVSLEAAAGRPPRRPHRP